MTLNGRTFKTPLTLAVAALLVSCLFAELACASSKHLVSLTIDTYMKETEGKVVFIKFFAPWCDHCKGMAADWEKLAKHYAKNNDKSVLIAEADCTSEDGGDELCEDLAVSEFPTLKFGDPLALEDYDGELDFESLLSFAQENLKPKCGPHNLELCDAAKKELIGKLQQLSMEELEKKAGEIEESAHEVDEWFSQETEKLQGAYQKLYEDFTLKRKDILDSKDFRLVKSVLNTKHQEHLMSEASTEL